MNRKNANTGLLILIVGAVVTMIAVIPVDQDWTLFLRAHRLKGLTKFMDRSLFEGEGFGGGDPVIILLILVLAGYLLTWKKNADIRLRMWRPQLGFILTGGLTCCFIMVHSMKWSWGRARPAVVLKEHLPFTHWFEFGPHYITDGVYSGSFPSGHTAQAFSIMAVAYALSCAPVRQKLFGKLGKLWAAGTLLFAATMGVTRCMNASHWVSDTVGSVGLGWIVMHLLYHRTLGVPMQNSHFRRHGAHPDLPAVWELRICLHILGAALAATALVLGLRAAFREAPVYLYLSIPPGVAGLLFFIVRIKRLRRRISNAYQGHPPSTASSGQ